MTTRINSNDRRGSALLEFTLVGIPLIFILISTFEMARGMWMYATLAHAVKEGTRYAVVHGYWYKNDCENNTQGHAPGTAVCQIGLYEIASAIRDAGVGMIPADVINVSFTAGASAAAPAGGTTFSCGGTNNSLQDCLNGTQNSNPWTNAAVTPGLRFSITAQYRFQSAIAMFWPGAGRGMQFPAFNLPASSTDTIQF